MLSRKFREGCLDDVQALLQVFLETITGVIGLSLLDFHHHAERLSGLKTEVLEKVFKEGMNDDLT